MNNVYWVVSRDCNQTCGHCYNNSGPGAPGITLEQASAVVANLPDPDDVPLDRIALSGGEPLVWPELLFHTLAELRGKYAGRTIVAVQSNGDRLDGPTLDRLIDHGVTRMSISSLDRYHLAESRRRQPMLEELFRSRGFQVFEFTGNGPGDVDLSRPHVSFWGATDDLWIGPLWPRGRAERNGLSKATTQHNFCGHGSGAKGFLDYRSPECSINIQLADAYPCCPLTCRPIGDLGREALIPMLDRLAAHPVYRALNEGRPEKMAEYLGLTEGYGFARSEALGNHCLWCDEFFTRHAPDLLAHGGRTERGAIDLTIRGRRLAGVPERLIREEFAADRATPRTTASAAPDTVPQLA